MSKLIVNSPIYTSVYTFHVNNQIFLSFVKSRRVSWFKISDAGFVRLHKTFLKIEASADRKDLPIHRVPE